MQYFPIVHLETRAHSPMCECPACRRNDSRSVLCKALHTHTKQVALVFTALHTAQEMPSVNPKLADLNRKTKQTRRFAEPPLFIPRDDIIG